MAQPVVDKTNIRTLLLKPGIIVWYCEIPWIIRSIFSKTTYHNYRPMVNEIFKKDDFVPGIFHTDEMNIVNGFKAFKKQAEWLSGRYLVKQLIHSRFLGDSPLDRITLGALDQGAPFVSNLPDLPVSLSHSYDYTAVAVCGDTGKTIGLDLEKIQKKPDHGFLKTAFTSREIRHMPDDAESIFKHWTIKEAFLKYIKKGFHESLHKVEVIDNTIRHHGTRLDLTIRSAKIADDYIVSLVCD